MTKTTNRCSVCQKQPGTSYCTGCGVYFCTRDFQSHRRTLNNEMGAIIAHRNDLQDIIYKVTERHDPHGPLFTKIDEWQKMMIEQVKLTAEKTRQEVAYLLSFKRTKLGNDFKQFSQEIGQLQRTENFVEYDLARLKRMIGQFNHELKQIAKPSTIELHSEQSNRLIWNRLIYAEERSTYAGLQRRENQVNDEQHTVALASARQQPPGCRSISARFMVELLVENLVFEMIEWMNKDFVTIIHLLDERFSSNQRRLLVS